MNGPSRKGSHHLSLIAIIIASAPDVGTLSFPAPDTTVISNSVGRSGPDCPFRIRCNYHEKNGSARVTTVDDVHTCVSSSGRPASQDIKRAEASKLKFLIEAVPKHMTVVEQTTTKEIIDAVKEYYGQDIALRQAQKVKSALCPKPMALCKRCKKVHSRKRCPEVLKPRTRLRNGPSTQRQTETTDMDWGPTGEVFQVTDQVEAISEPSTYGLAATLSAPLAEVLPIMSVQPDRNEVPEIQQIPTTVDPSLTVERPRQPLRSETRQKNPTTLPMGNRSTATGLIQQLPRTPQETRMEAARLMQNAARLMQEAARLNNEAARLTASVANL